MQFNFNDLFYGDSKKQLVKYGNKTSMKSHTIETTGHISNSVITEKICFKILPPFQINLDISIEIWLCKMAANQPAFSGDDHISVIQAQLPLLQPRMCRRGTKQHSVHQFSKTNFHDFSLISPDFSTYTWDVLIIVVTAKFLSLFSQKKKYVPRLLHVSPDFPDQYFSSDLSLTWWTL